MFLRCHSLDTGCGSIKFITESVINMHLKMHTVHVHVYVTQLHKPCIHAYPFSGSSAFNCFGNCALS